MVGGAERADGLVLDRNGTPTRTYGEGFKAHLLTVKP